MRQARTIGAFVAATAAALGPTTCATSASAQSMDTPSASFNAGWGRATTSSNGGIVLKNGRDQNGNRLIVDGVMQTGSDQSSYAYSDTGGAYDKQSGAGHPGTYTAIGNSLNVSVNGSWNTVIVDSTQINNGDVVAGPQGELNGGVHFDD